MIHDWGSSATTSLRSFGMHACLSNILSSVYWSELIKIVSKGFPGFRVSSQPHVEVFHQFINQHLQQIDGRKVTDNCSNYKPFPVTSLIGRMLRLGSMMTTNDIQISAPPRS